MKYFKTKTSYSHKFISKLNHDALQRIQFLETQHEPFEQSILMLTEMITCIQNQETVFCSRQKNASEPCSQSGYANHLAWGKALWEVCQPPPPPPPPAKKKKNDRKLNRRGRRLFFFFSFFL